MSNFVERFLELRETVAPSVDAWFDEEADVILDEAGQPAVESDFVERAGSGPRTDIDTFAARDTPRLTTTRGSGSVATSPKSDIDTRGGADLPHR